jgi:uncharacterized protein YcaQ
MPTTSASLRQYTVARNFPKPASLQKLLERVGFVQADPIRSPARAQDLILRHRVNDYRAGDLERNYSALEVEEDFFINYGYVTQSLQSLMHPRATGRDIYKGLPASQRRRAKDLLAFVCERGEVHPREVAEHFSHGRVTNYWGGSSNATTHLLDAMHYAGMLNIARREKGIRVYKAHQHEQLKLTATERRSRIDALADVVINIYAPLPASSLTYYLRRLRYATPQWESELKSAIERAKKKLRHENLDGVEWYWPEEGQTESADIVRLLAPFDPVVHDRKRFELLWGWTYRFEAYTPAPKRKLGYYAMPMLWRNQVMGWANLSVVEGKLITELGYVVSEPRERVFKHELEAELERIRLFLGLQQ